MIFDIAVLVKFLIAFWAVIHRIVSLRQLIEDFLNQIGAFLAFYLSRRQELLVRKTVFNLVLRIKRRTLTYQNIIILTVLKPIFWSIHLNHVLTSSWVDFRSKGSKIVGLEVLVFRFMWQLKYVSFKRNCYLISIQLIRLYIIWLSLMIHIQSWGRKWLRLIIL